ncbi:MAG: hypothetical protein MJH11_21710 [Lentisphaeria bacterium]|nr:hypothetical protein [Lentisphaeria bacterium]
MKQLIISLLLLLTFLPYQSFAKEKKSYIEITLDDSGWGDWFQIFWKDWKSHDVSKKKYLTFYLRVLKGNADDLKISLSVGGKAQEAVKVKDYGKIRRSWNKIKIPLKDLEANLEDIKSIVLQRKKGKTTIIGIDEISFDKELLWGNGEQHNGLKETGGTKVEHEIKVGGK